MQKELRFYKNNLDIFAKYFDDSTGTLQMLIAASNVKKIEEVIKERSNFNTNEFLNNV